MSEKPIKSIESIIKKDGRYPLEAVEFIREGLSYTVEKYHQELDPKVRRHVSGPQLCQGLRELAQNRWGLMARSVLQRWNINRTRDIGEIVFLLVDNGWMQKQPQDNIDDFDNVYDFREVFDNHFDISLEE